MGPCAECWCLGGGGEVKGGRGGGGWQTRRYRLGRRNVDVEGRLLSIYVM